MFRALVLATAASAVLGYSFPSAPSKYGTIGGGASSFGVSPAKPAAKPVARAAPAGRTSRFRDEEPRRGARSAPSSFGARVNKAPAAPAPANTAFFMAPASSSADASRYGFSTKNQKPSGQQQFGTGKTSTSVSAAPASASPSTSKYGSIGGGSSFGVSPAKPAAKPASRPAPASGRTSRFRDEEPRRRSSAPAAKSSFGFSSKPAGKPASSFGLSSSSAAPAKSANTAFYLSPVKTSSGSTTTLGTKPTAEDMIKPRAIKGRLTPRL